MVDYDRAKECIQGLKILFDCAEELPEYICSCESYPIDKTTVLSDIKLSSFRFVIGEAMEIIEHMIKKGEL